MWHGELMRVLVIGAAGKTGRAVTAALAQRGVSVRAAVRVAPSAHPGELGSVSSADSSGSGPAPTLVAAAGATEVVAVDLETGEGLIDATRGVDAIYHLAPNVHPDEVGIARRVLDAAQAAGVRRFVFHSVLHPHDSAMPHHMRKAEAEELVRGGIPEWTVLQPAAYMQNLVAAALAGRIAVPYSLDAPFTLVDLSDVAEVAARVLTEPGHARATYELAGPEHTTVRELAAQASAVLGRHVDAVEIDVASWVTGPGAGLPTRALADLLAMFAAYDTRGLAGNSRVLRMLLGRPPTAWRELLAREAG